MHGILGALKNAVFYTGNILLECIDITSSFGRIIKGENGDGNNNRLMPRLRHRHRFLSTLNTQKGCYRTDRDAFADLEDGATGEGFEGDAATDEGDIAFSEHLGRVGRGLPLRHPDQVDPVCSC